MTHEHVLRAVDRQLAHNANPEAPPSTNLSFAFGDPPWRWGKSTERTVVDLAWNAASFVSTVLCTYHGYQRTKTVGNAVLWGLAGGIFPGFAPAIAYAQGFGEPAAAAPQASTLSVTPSMPHDTAWLLDQRAKNAYLLNDAGFLHAQAARDALAATWGYPQPGPPVPWLLGAGIAQPMPGVFEIHIGVRPGSQHPDIPANTQGVPISVMPSEPTDVLVEPAVPNKPVV